VVDDFLAPVVAQKMRAAAESHLGDAYWHSPLTHSDWDYWYVPDQYTYLRTLPERIIGERLTDEFRTAIDDWARERLGLAAHRHCYLSLYVDGCRQRQHNDAGNGRFGFVYSLTRDQRRTTGGETLLWCDRGNSASRVHIPSSAVDFYDSIEPRFNRLLVFDDRVPHAVELVEGSMDPLEGRLVIHGHIREVGPIVSGGVSFDDALTAAHRVACEQAAELGDALRCYHGVVTVRLSVEPEGTVVDAHIVLDRLRRLRRGGPEIPEVLAGLLQRAAELRFTPGALPATVTLPFAFG
jgi:hypothetical protein